jgi:hypothetical protein
MTRIGFPIVILALLAAACGVGATPTTPDPNQAPQTAVVATDSSAESPAKTDQTPGEGVTRVAWPSARIHPTLVHDPVGQQLLMLSGMSRMQRTVDLREVWSLDTGEYAWESIGESGPFDALINFGADIESGQVITFNLEPAQTWSFDLASQTWQQQEPATQPESTSANPRFGAPLTYDVESDRLVLFAGGSPWHMYADTWAYDYDTDTWELMDPTSSPSPRAMYATAYDSESDRVLLWGGFTGTDENDVQMWAYDYNTDSWEALANSDGPQQHWERHGMAYIPEIDRVLFYSGMLEEEGVLPAETWYYDYNTNTWSAIDVDTSPPKLAMYGIAYDPEVGKVVVFGGEKTSKYATDLSSDIWVFDPETENWSLIPSPAGTP